MEIKATVKIQGKLLKAVMANPAEVSRKILWSGMVNLVEEIEARAKKEAPVRTSNLVNSITSSVSSGGLKGEITAGAKYAEFVHRGTYLQGPFKQTIPLTIIKALFRPGAAHPVKWPKGMKPNPFFSRALKQIKPQKVFEDGALGYLKSLGG